MNFFIDVETTGFDYLSNCVIELACACEINGELKTFNQKIRPLSKAKWSVGAERVHGISYDQAANFTHPKIACHDFLGFLEQLAPYERYGLPHHFWYHGNNAFDWHFVAGLFLKQDLLFELRKYLQGSYVFSTIDLAKNKLQLTNYKLSTVCDYLDIELNHHQALSDAQACMEIHRRLVNENKTL